MKKIPYRKVVWCRRGYLLLVASRSYNNDSTLLKRQFKLRAFVKSNSGERAIIRAQLTLPMPVGTVVLVQRPELTVPNLLKSWCPEISTSRMMEEFCGVAPIIMNDCFYLALVFLIL